MKTTTSSIVSAIAASLFALGTASTHAAMAIPLQNASTDLVGAPQFTTVSWEESRAEKLRHAYYLLDHADADYHGHKVEALHQLKEAARLNGIELKWHGGHGEEAQWNSDRRLREARTILKSLVAPGKEQIHLQHAIKELDKALATR